MTLRVQVVVLLAQEWLHNRESLASQLIMVVNVDKEIKFVASPYWRDFEGYINTLLKNETNKLIYATDQHEKSVCQGKAQAYTTILSLKERA